MEELNIVLEKMTAQLKSRLPFAIYSKPGQAEVFAILQKNDARYSTEDFSENGFVFAPFDGNENILIPASQSETLVTTSISAKADSFRNLETQINPGEKAFFEALVSKAIKSIKDGAFSKVVLSRKEIVTVTDFDLAAVFLKMLSAYPTAFRYCFFHPASGLWIGATPERLLKSTGKSFSTVALAGTQKVDGPERGTWGEKEKQEQQFVTDFIWENLSTTASELKVSQPYTEKAGSLLHIKTDISGVLTEDNGVGGMIKILHPTPAVCGFPKAAAKKFILSNEGYEREFYSGFLGELNMAHSGTGITDIYVNLRCMQIKDSNAHIYMGCGITADSNPELEFMETVNKSATMKKIL